MRRFVFCLLFGGLMALVAARAFLPEPMQAQTVMARAGDYGYNILDLDLPISTETAGSALIAEMNGYYLFRTPTARSRFTGTLRGMNLILICADNWREVPAADKTAAPGLYRLWHDGIRFGDVYRPDWYQGMEGREFALLSGVTPTNVNGISSFVWVGRQPVFLPYAPAQYFSREGYYCLAVSPEPAADSYGALGFSHVLESGGSAMETLTETLPGLSESEPFFAYYRWDDEDGEAALEYLLDTLKDNGLLDNTAVCLLTAGDDDCRAHLFLMADGLSGLSADSPCSELDLAPTLLNLFGADFDSRFLSGRDILAPGAEPGAASAATPLVTLYGSAYSDWVTDAGSYYAADGLFWRTDDCFSDTYALFDYVKQVNQLVYDRYTFARRVMENNYFQLVLGQR